MNRRNAWTRPCAGWVSEPGYIATRLPERLIIAEFIAGTVFGHSGTKLYLQLERCCGQPLHGGNNVGLDLILCSVFVALIMSSPSGVTSHTRIDTRFPQTLPGQSDAAVILIGVGLTTCTLPDLTRSWAVFWASLFMCWIWTNRLYALSYLQLVAERSRFRERVAIIGEEATIDQLIEKIETEADVVTVFRRRTGDTLGIGAALAHIAAMAREGAVGLVVIAIDVNCRKDFAEAVLRRLKAIPVRVAVCLEARQPGSAALSFDVIAGVPLTVLATRPLGPRDLLVKSLLDKAGALFLLLLVSPLMLGIGLMIYLETPGSVLFRQTRTGWCGRLFTVYKFRTMYQLANSHISGQTLRADPRCTRVGAFLRRTSLDELPQLWNVLRGEMSLVGPRPHADFLHAGQRSNTFLLTEYLRRQRVKPGLTGWAQVHGYRGAADTPEKLRRRIELDLYYIEHWSLWLDIRIIARTPWAVVSAENAF
jgi:putative colanic acid biosynthesis UDP-glucose lipid carrier transferase